jgi:hypothetical protein
MQTTIRASDRHKMDPIQSSQLVAINLHGAKSIDDLRIIAYSSLNPNSQDSAGLWMTELSKCGFLQRQILPGGEMVRHWTCNDGHAMMPSFFTLVFLRFAYRCAN